MFSLSAGTGCDLWPLLFPVISDNLVMNSIDLTPALLSQALPGKFECSILAFSRAAPATDNFAANA